MHRRCRLLFALAPFALLAALQPATGQPPRPPAPRARAVAAPAPAAAHPPLRFAVRLDAAAADAAAALGLEPPYTGRLLVIVSRQGEPEPRAQVGVTGVPFWGRDVEGYDVGEVALFDTTGADAPGETSAGGVIGYPLPSFADLPAGEYWVQPFLNVYTRFDRADGHTLWMHLNSGAGQRPLRSPGNLVGRPVKLRLDPARGGEFELALESALPPIEPLQPGEVLQQGNPRDRDLVRFVKIRSRLLSEFWGRDVYIGANVLLPRGWEEQPGRRYPAIYLQGHFPGRRAPFGYGDTRPGSRGAEFTAFWDSPEAPELVAVTFRDANPYYDTSYSVDSANVGPYGSALTEELMPYLERTFRLIPEEWARVTAGGSTGGWEALAMQIFYPEVFGGAWGWCPDPVDFHYYQIVNVYEDANAYVTGNEWHRIERPNARRPDGNIVSTVRMENLMELALGPKGRSAGQWAIWQAVFGPVGEDGYPAPIWDPVTGVIDRAVAEYWGDHFDLHQHLRRTWSRVGPALRGKLHVAVGDMDTYYLEEAVYLLQEFLDSVQDPPAQATFEYGRRQPHCWIGHSPSGSGQLTYAEFVQRAARLMASRRPAGDVR